MAVCDSGHRSAVLDRGDTLPRRPRIRWVERSPVAWVERQHWRPDTAVVAVELAGDATPLTRLAPARGRTIVLRGHERHGVPDHVWLAGLA